MFFPETAGPVLPRRLRTVLWLVFLLTVLTLTRWALAPQYLYYFDSINFALSLDRFDPWHHQPQPPGYPLFVGALRLVHPGFDDPQQVMVATGILIAFAAVLLTFRLGSEIYSRPAGFLAAALLIFNPPFWFGGITNQVRLGLAMCSAGTALLAWKALQRPENSRWLFLAFGALGVAAGFRPADCVLLVPLLMWVWLRTDARPARLALALCSLMAGALPWIAVTAWAVGGPSRWAFLMWTYGRDQFRGTSLLFGAHPASAWEMGLRACVWTGLGVLTWIWAVPLQRPRTDANFRQKAGFFSAWLLPPFLFSLIIHIGDPDQALATVVGLCVLGGGVLWRATNRFPWLRPAAVAFLVAAANATLFFVPPGRIAALSTWEVVRSTDERLQEAFNAIDAVHGTGPVAIIHYGSEVTWRHLFYYRPADCLLYLPQDAGELPMSFRDRRLLKEGPDAPHLPAVRRIIVLAPHLNAKWMVDHNWQSRGPIYWRDSSGDDQIELGTWHVSTSKNQN